MGKWNFVSILQMANEKKASSQTCCGYKALQSLAEFVRFYELLAFPFGTEQFKTDSWKLKRQLAEVCTGLSSAKMVHPRWNLWGLHVIVNERIKPKSVFSWNWEKLPVRFSWEAHKWKNTKLKRKKERKKEYSKVNNKTTQVWLLWEPKKANYKLYTYIAKFNHTCSWYKTRNRGFFSFQTIQK